MLKESLKDKVAIVCASSKGLGFAAAQKLACSGVNIVMCARNKDQLLASAKEISSLGVVVVPVIADMSGKPPIPRTVL